MTKKLDPQKYASVLSFLQKHFTRYDFAPTYDQILTGAGLSSKCLVKPYLDRLMKDGLVEKEAGNHRALRLTPKGRKQNLSSLGQPRVAAYVSKAARLTATAVERLVRLQVVGRTFAGQTTPIPNADFSTFDSFSTIDVSEDVLPPRSKTNQFFALEVRGDSMIEAGIYDGDYVICRKSDTAENNDMVVALRTDVDETTLKYYIREKDHIRLQPANGTMKPILIYDTRHLIIQAVVVQVVHCP